MNNNKSEKPQLYKYEPKRVSGKTSIPKRCQKLIWIADQLLFCLKPFVVFLQLKLGKSIFSRIFLNSPGLLDSIRYLDWAPSETRVIRLRFRYLLSSGFGVRSNFTSREKFSDYKRKVVVLVFPKLMNAFICFKHVHWNIRSILLDVGVCIKTIISQ